MAGCTGCTGRTGRTGRAVVAICWLCWQAKTFTQSVDPRSVFFALHHIRCGSIFAQFCSSCVFFSFSIIFTIGIPLVVLVTFICAGFVASFCVHRAWASAVP